MQILPNLRSLSRSACLLWSATIITLAGCRNDHPETLSIQVIQEFPERDLRGYGRVSGEDGVLPGGAHLLTVECESSEKANVLQAKFLSDLQLLPKVSRETQEVDGETIEMIQADGQGYILAGRKESAVRILSSESLDGILEGIKGLDWSGWEFNTDVEVPMYLDRWDKWGFRAHFRPWTAPPKNYLQSQEGEAYDYVEELDFAEEMGQIGFVTFNGPHSMDTAAGLDNSMWWEWMIPLAEERGLPFGLNIKVAEGVEAPWLMNRYRDQEMQPMPQFSGSYMRIGSPYFGTRGTSSWAAVEANQIQFDLAEAALRRFEDNNNMITVLEPHGELKNLAHSIFLEYGPLADTSYQEYLRSRYESLAELNR
ncbi:MAG: hypothetical protein ACQKBT_11415, partial [Puniceicoccales bacterium]